uniref:MD-2-related lipid-recognition domain-containing protein n=1 Tax=Amphimedon queenslandica TaxID=400682 RepID=A0A1X7TQC7_AMPQE
MSALLMTLSVVLAVSTLTGSTNNYYNAVTKKFAELTNATLTPLILKRGELSYWQGILQTKRTIQWAVLHAILTHNFKNYTNITFIDEKFNLCDFFVDVIQKHCPLQPGIYHWKFNATVPKLLWPGQYHGKATVYNEKGDEIICITKQCTID